MAPSRVRIPPSPLAQRPPRFCAHPRRGGRAVECGGLENRYPSLGGSRVQIPPPPLPEPEPMRTIGSRAYADDVRYEEEPGWAPPRWFSRALLCLRGAGADGAPGHTAGSEAGVRSDLGQVAAVRLQLEEGVLVAVLHAEHDPLSVRRVGVA